MAPKTGLSAQLGVAIESTPGLPATPTTWVPLISEDLTQDIERAEPDDIIAGRVVRTSEQWDEGDITVGGGTQFSWKRRGFGKILAALLGVPSTTGSGTYTHTYGLTDLPSLTLQVGRPDVGGTVNPFTYAGMMAASGEFNWAAGDPIMCGVDWAGIHEIGYRQSSGDGTTTSGNPGISSATANFTPNDIGKPISGTNIPSNSVIRTVISATSATLGDASGAAVNASGTGSTSVLTIGVALASPSYTIPRSFYARTGAATIAGAAAKVTAATLSIDNGLDVERRYVGQQFIGRPLEADLRTIEGSLEMEFEGVTHYDRFRRASEFALVLSALAGTDSGTFTLNVRADGETPSVGGRGKLVQNLPFTAVASGADNTAMAAVLVNADSSY